MRSQRLSWPSSHTLVTVTSSLAPGAAATKYWNALAELSTRASVLPTCVASHSRSAACGSIDVAHSPSSSGVSSPEIPRRRNRRERRSWAPTSHTTVRLPRRAPAMATAAATALLPTPPLPAVQIRRLSSIDPIAMIRLSMTTTLSTELAGSYELCRRIHRRFDPTYYWATRRLPPDVRPAVHALYGFVRGADELVDGPRRPPDPAARRAALDAWEAELVRGMARGRSEHPVIGALGDAGDRHDLPLDELRVYMRSMRVDCGRVRIATAEELDRYMDGSAGSVGRIMAPLLGVPSADAEAFGAMGRAFQLTNFIRDVREDWVLDRVYLPDAEPAELTRREASPRLRELVATEVDRARGLFAATAPAAAASSERVRPGIRLARAVYLRVLDRIERGGYDVLGRRTELTALELSHTVVKAFLTVNGSHA